MKAQKQKRINLYSVKGASRFDQSIQSKIIALAFSMASEIERDLISISQCPKEALRFKKAQGMKLGRLTAPAKRKLDPYRPEIENPPGKWLHPTFIARRSHTTEANLHKHGLNC